MASTFFNHWIQCAATNFILLPRAVLFRNFQLVMNVMRNVFVTSLITSISILLMTCGETEMKPPPTPGPGTGPPASGPITDEQRLAVLKECSDFVNAIGDLRSAAAQQLLVTWLKARPEFEEADTLGGNVWAYFLDGRVAMFVPDQLNDGRHDGGRIIAEPVKGGRKKTLTEVGRTSGQPGSNQVKLFHGHGEGFFDYRPLLKSIFSMSKTQYKDKVTLEEATIENLKNTNDLGVFFISTHGGMGLKKPKKDNNRLFGLWTTDTTSLESERTYGADLNSNYLVYMHALYNNGVKEWHYGFTEYYVRNHAYMNFAENALVYIDACHSIGPNADALKESMVKKAKGEKATYIGWTNVSDNYAGEAAAAFVFDRMLGTNMDIDAHDGAIASEDPEQRPFDFGAIFKNMRNFTVDGYPVGVSRSGGSLAYHSTHVTETILTPSIEYITVDEYESKMYIKGLFGDYNSSDLIVTVGGGTIPAEYFDKNILQCDLPTTGSRSVGDVIVSIRGNKSNVVPLTEWIIPLDFEKDEMEIKLKGRLNLRIRGDVHPYRSKPGEAPKIERPDSLGFLNNPNFIGWPFAIGSTGNYSTWGRRYTECVIEKCHIIESLTAVSKNGVLPYSIFEAPGDGFVVYYKWSVDMKTVYVTALHAKVPDVGHEFESRVACNGDPVESSQSDNRELEIRIPEDLPVLHIHFDENYNIQAGDFESSTDVENGWGACMKTVKLNVKAQWPNVSPNRPPTIETEARVGGE